MLVIDNKLGICKDWQEKGLYSYYFAKGSHLEIIKEEDVVYDL